MRHNVLTNVLLSETRLGVRKDTILCVLKNETRTIGPRRFGLFAKPSVLDDQSRSIVSSGLDDSLTLGDGSEVDVVVCV